MKKCVIIFLLIGSSVQTMEKQNVLMHIHTETKKELEKTTAPVVAFELRLPHQGILRDNGVSKSPRKKNTDPRYDWTNSASW